MKYNFQDKLIWIMVYCWLIVDTITGFFSARGLTLPISQYYKFMVLTFVMLRCISIPKYGLVTSLLIIYVSVMFIHLTIIDSAIGESLVILSKFLSMVLIYIYFRFCVKLFKKKFIENSERAFLFAGLTIAINVMLGLFGFGVPSYGEGAEEMGLKGYFFAGNELGGLVCTILPFLIYLMIKRYYGIKFIALYLGVIFVGILIGTKTAILSTILSAIIIPYLYLARDKRKKFLLIWTIIFVIAAIKVVAVIDELDIGAITRWTYFYDSGGINRLIFSGRDEFWEMKKNVFFDSSLFCQALGIGKNGKIVERDHLDAMFLFGYIGAFFIMLFLVYLLTCAIRYRYRNSLMKVVIFSDVLVILIGYLAGHVWFSAMASLYIALINAYTLIKCQSNLYEERIFS